MKALESNVAKLNSENVALAARNVVQDAAIACLEGDVSNLQKETYALCMPKAMIETAQIVPRFLGRQDRSQGNAAATRIGYIGGQTGVNHVNFF